MIIACSFILKLVLTLLSFQDVGHMDSEQQETTPQTMKSLDSNGATMDTYIIMGECDENTQEQSIEQKKKMQTEAEDANKKEEENNLKDNKEEEEKMSEGGNDNTKEQSSEIKKRKETGAEDGKKTEEEDNLKDKEEDEIMSEGENADTAGQSCENKKTNQSGTEGAKKTEEEDNLKDDKNEDERMSEGENDDIEEQSSENKKTKQTGTEGAKKTEEEDNLKDDKNEDERMSEGENDDREEQSSENKKRNQSETEDMKEEEEKNLKDDKGEGGKMLEGEKEDTKEQSSENKKRKQNGVEDAKKAEEEDNLKDNGEKDERMSEGENDDKKEQSSESKKRKKKSETEDTKEEEENNLKDDEDFFEEKKFEEIKFPDTLEGFNYKFNSDGQLRDIETDEPFQFVIKPDDHYYNQKRYEALGEILNGYVYDLLESECNLKRITVPLDTDKDAVEGEPKSFVFASENAFTTTGKLMILIHGSGVVRAGQWARRLIINDCLESGTQIPYIKRAKEEGYEILVLNTNENEGKDGNDIRGSETPVKHALYVLQHLLKQKVASGKPTIAIVAHSYGGCVVLGCIEKNFLKSVFAIAFTDSVHQLQFQLNSPMHQSWLIQHSRNWVSCDKELDEKLPHFSYKKDVDRYSAGTTKHEETSWKAMESIFEYLNTKAPKHLQKKKPEATQNEETKEVNTKEEKHEEQNPNRKKSDKKKL